MADILEEIIAYKRKEVERYKQELAQDVLESRIDIGSNDHRVMMKEVLATSQTGIIAEFKRKSPSKGWINKEADPGIIAPSYQQNGASALSILADTRFFGGSVQHIRCARARKVTIPILCKNFIIDDYQVYQAKLFGATAILLIAACLEKAECKRLIDKAHELKLEVLLEMHSEEETEYADLGPDMCGINNRNLGTFDTDVQNSFQLVGRLPSDAVKVSESGISDPQTVKQLRDAGFRGFLIGENFMSAPDPGQALASFISRL